jgi:hypothetical protein
MQKYPSRFTDTPTHTSRNQGNDSDWFTRNRRPRLTVYDYALACQFSENRLKMSNYLSRKTQITSLKSRALKEPLVWWATAVRLKRDHDIYGWQRPWTGSALFNTARFNIYSFTRLIRSSGLRSLGQALNLSLGVQSGMWATGGVGSWPIVDAWMPLWFAFVFVTPQLSW